MSALTKNPTTNFDDHDATIARVQSLDCIFACLSALNKWVKQTRPTSLAAALLTRKDVDVAIFSSAFGSGADLHFAAMSVSHLRQTKAALGKELRSTKRKKAKLGKKIRRKIRQCITKIDGILSLINVRTSAPLESIAVQHTELSPLCADAHTETERWATGTKTRTPKKEDEIVAEELRKLARIKRKLADCPTYGPRLLKSLGTSVEDAQAEFEALHPQYAADTLTPTADDQQAADPNEFLLGSHNVPDSSPDEPVQAELSHDTHEIQCGTQPQT